jgi:hypothetical protein
MPDKKRAREVKETRRKRKPTPTSWAFGDRQEEE